MTTKCLLCQISRSHRSQLTSPPCAALGASQCASGSRRTAVRSRALPPGLSLPAPPARVLTELLLVVVFSGLFLLLSRVSFEPNRVPSSGARWHLRQALNSDGARGAGGAPSSSSSSGPSRSSSSSRRTAGRDHSFALRTEEKSSWNSDRLWKRLARSTCSPGHSQPTGGISSVPRGPFSVEIILLSPGLYTRNSERLRK